jgi:hypothetical protein
VAFIVKPSGVCAWCGEPFARNRVGRPAQFCKRGCRQRHYEEQRALRAIKEKIAQGALPDFVTDARDNGQ